MFVGVTPKRFSTLSNGSVRAGPWMRAMMRSGLSGLAVAVGVSVAVAVGVDVAVGVAGGVEVSVGVAVAVGVHVEVAVAVGIRVEVSVGARLGNGPSVGSASGPDTTVGSGVRPQEISNGLKVAAPAHFRKRRRVNNADRVVVVTKHLPSNLFSQGGGRRQSSDRCRCQIRPVRTNHRSLPRQSRCAATSTLARRGTSSAT